MDLEVSVLIENQCCNSNRLLKYEHGLSLHISNDGTNILFDTGASGAFIENAKNMGISIEDIDIVVLSHAHLDHAGGLIKFLEENKKAKVYMSRNVKDNHYIRVFVFDVNISLPKEIFNKYLDRVCFVANFTEIAEYAYLIPNSLEHSFPLGRSSKKLLVKKEGKIQKDNFDHELSLVIYNNDKLEIFTGCSHNGISNMVEHAISFFPNTHINSVIGGFHLMGIPFKRSLGESVSYIKELGKQMLEYNIEKIYTAHCTGVKAYKILKEVMGDKITYLHTGMRIKI